MATEGAQWLEELPDKVPELLVCDGTGQWSALYVNGQLDYVGDLSNVEERIREIAGVVTVQTDDFMRGGDERYDVANNFLDLVEYRNERLKREARARDLRAEASRLLAEAKEIEAQK